MAAVRVIPATRGVNAIRAQEVAKTKVAAYCRVSTEMEEQEGSYEAQIQHYSSFINGHPSWELAGIYADQGISATSTKNREQFNRMIADAKNGLIEMIITKSISRFARNTLDCLTYIRELKAIGVAVYFEKENINTLDAKGEVLLTIMASLAQQESASISKNVKMGIDYRHQQGRFTIDVNRFLGYTWDENHNLVIVPEEAVTVKRVFRDFIEGYSYSEIARRLNRDGIKSGRGGKWGSSTVKNMLTNEKYKGDVLMQKTVTVDMLTHKRKKNEGEESMYLKKFNHEPIIPRKVFDLVQDEIARRDNYKKKHGRIPPASSKYALSGLVYCARCNHLYRRYQRRYKDRVWAEWKCENKAVKTDNCLGRIILEDDLHRMVLEAVNTYINNKDTHLKILEQEFKSLEHFSIVQWMKDQPAEMTEFDDLLVKKLIKKIVVYEKFIRVTFKTGECIDIK